MTTFHNYLSGYAMDADGQLITQWNYPMPDASTSSKAGIAAVALAALLSTIADVANAERLHGYVSQYDWARIVAAAAQLR